MKASEYYTNVTTTNAAGSLNVFSILAGHAVKNHQIKTVNINAMTNHACSKNSNMLLKKNGLRQIRFHDLRHTCASMLAAAGVPMK